MNRNLRILGVVACLLVLWMVVRGTNGCAMPDPDQKTTVTILPESSDKDAFAEAQVYFGGKQIKNTHANHLSTSDPYALNVKGTHTGQGKFEVEWYTALEGPRAKVLITVMNKAKDRHTHYPLEVDDKTASKTITLYKMTP